MTCAEEFTKITIYFGATSALAWMFEQDCRLINDGIHNHGVLEMLASTARDGAPCICRSVTAADIDTHGSAAYHENITEAYARELIEQRTPPQISRTLYWGAQHDRYHVIFNHLNSNPLPNLLPKHDAYFRISFSIPHAVPIGAIRECADRHVRILGDRFNLLALDESNKTIHTTITSSALEDVGTETPISLKEKFVQKSNIPEKFEHLKVVSSRK